MSATAPPGWVPRRGEVYIAPVDKPRPVVIISRDSLNAYSFDVGVVPLTRVHRAAFSFRPKLSAGDGGLKTPSWAKCDQLATIPKTALRYPAIGNVSDDAMSAIAVAIKRALKLP